MGPRKRAGRGARAAARAGGALLVLGFCGGLDGASVPGEVVVAERGRAAADEGHARSRSSCAGAEQLVAALTGRGLEVRSGAVVCVSRLALGERRAQLHAGGAIAVDMESVWLAPGAGRAAVRRRARGARQPSHELLRPQAAPGRCGRRGRCAARPPRFMPAAPAG